jgi:hypothetical protein
VAAGLAWNAISVVVIDEAVLTEMTFVRRPSGDRSQATRTKLPDEQPP